MAEKRKRDVKVQDISRTLMISIPKDIAEAMNISKGVVLGVGTEIIGGTHVVYYRKGNNINHKG